MLKILLFSMLVFIFGCTETHVARNLGVGQTHASAIEVLHGLNAKDVTQGLQVEKVDGNGNLIPHSKNKEWIWAIDSHDIVLQTSFLNNQLTELTIWPDARTKYRGDEDVDPLVPIASIEFLADGTVSYMEVDNQ